MLEGLSNITTQNKSPNMWAQKLNKLDDIQQNFKKGEQGSKAEKYANKKYGSKLVIKKIQKQVKDGAQGLLCIE